MHLPSGWLSCLVSFFDVLTLNSFGKQQLPQKSLQAQDVLGPPPGPIFPPPYSPADPPPPDVAIKCDYSAMNGFKLCNYADSRGCWLTNPQTGEEYNIKTDYEHKWPKGRTRRYVLDVNEMALAPDGMSFPNAKVFNGSYPGPWIQACWGDDIEVTVRNHLWYNGTSIHWHGIRQWNTTEMDGVNAVTQCPIAPNEEFTYKFKALQYGSSWYHSHYSLQYGDGLAGPMTIYGPSSANYTDAIDPILMTDWNHRSAFQDWAWSLRPEARGPIPMTNILLNGKGRYQSLDPKRPIGQPERYSQVFTKGKHYLLRLINTSLDTTFVFSIDGHNITVIGSDFVPITPYETNAVLVGIGQRYHVVVKAIPITPYSDDNYWIRTIPADGCHTFPQKPDNRTGIIRYNAENTYDPTSDQHKLSVQCSDEPYHKLKPILEWTIGDPVNKEASKDLYVVGLKNVSKNPYHPDRPMNRWTAANMPLWLDFGKPTINNLNPSDGAWSPTYDIVTHDHPEKSWIYLVITAHEIKNKPPVIFPAVAHPIHLHGHDFALLYQSQRSEKYPGDLGKVPLTKKNPPRRDVVLLPEGGYIVIAFKADNPGAWLLHCHIAFHASSGLGFQIFENRHLIDIKPESRKAIDYTCMKWNKWVDNVLNHWNTTTALEFQDDSGI